MKDIVVPYVEKERVNLNLPPSQPAVVVMGVFKGQLTTKVLGYLEGNHIYYDRVPMYRSTDARSLSWNVSSPHGTLNKLV